MFWFLVDWLVTGTFFTGTRVVLGKASLSAGLICRPVIGAFFAGTRVALDAASLLFWSPVWRPVGSLRWPVTGAFFTGALAVLDTSSLFVGSLRCPVTGAFFTGTLAVLATPSPPLCPPVVSLRCPLTGPFLAAPRSPPSPSLSLPCLFLGPSLHLLPTTLSSSPLLLTLSLSPNSLPTALLTCLASQLLSTPSLLAARNSLYARPRSVRMSPRRTASA